MLSWIETIYFHEKRLCGKSNFWHYKVLLLIFCIAQSITQVWTILEILLQKFSFSLPNALLTKQH